MKTAENTVIGVMLLVMIALAVQLPGIKSTAAAGQHYIPNTGPILFVGSAVVLFLWLILRGLSRSAPEQEPGQASQVRDIYRPRRLIFMTTSAIYCLVFDVLGFLTASLLYLFLASFLIGGRGRREALIGLVVAAAVVGVTYGIVIYGLESYLPVLDIAGWN